MVTMTSAGHWDWDAIYREGTPVWEMGEPSAELIRFLDEKRIGRGSALDVGCGTGADAIYMVRRGLEVTAVDNSPTAIERARVRAEQEDALPRFVLADFFDFAQGPAHSTLSTMRASITMSGNRARSLPRRAVAGDAAWVVLYDAGLRSRRVDRGQSAAGHEASTL